VATPTVIISAVSDIVDSGLISAVSSVSMKTTSALANTGIDIFGGISTTNGAISVISAAAGPGAGIKIEDFAQITASSQSAKTKATILLENSNTTSGTISIGKANIATAGAGGGDITVTVGAAKLVAGTDPGGITVSGSPGQVFFGAPGALDPASTATVILQGANLVFSSASKNANAIVLNGTTFNPDPPPSASLGKTTGAIGSFDASAASAPSRVSALAPTIAFAPANSLPGLAASAEADGAIAAPVVQAMPQWLNSYNAQTPRLSSALNWISSTEIDGGEIPVAVASDIKLELAADRKAEAADYIAGALDQEGSAAAPRMSTLNKGSVLMIPEVDTVVRTPSGNVTVAARSLALIMVFDRGLAVYNFDDGHKDSVLIEAGSKQLSLRPGTSAVVVTEGVKAFSEINPAQLVCYRHITEQLLGRGLKAYRAEFSMQSALEALKPLKAMICSTDKAAVRVSARFLKTTAILMQLQSGGENFRQILRAQMVASR
jgi:hypothetical protein